MSRRPIVEHPRRRGRARAAELARQAAAEARARDIMAGLADAPIAVLIALLRLLAAAVKARIGEVRAGCLLVGEAARIWPAYRPEADQAKSQALAIFKPRRAA